MNESPVEERLAQRLSQGLRDRAGDVSGAPVGLDDVKATARGIRRRRRAVTGLAAAAVVAVLVPVGLSAAGGPDAAPEPGPATTTPSTIVPSPSEPAPSVTRPPGEAVALTVTGAPDGAAPKVGYLSGRTYHSPDGTLTPLPAEYESVAPYRGGFLGLRLGRDGYLTEQVDGSGKVVGSEPGGDRIVVSDDGVEVSWVAGDRLYLDTTNGHSESPQSIALPQDLQSTAAPIGFVSAGTVVARIDTAGDGPDFYVTDFQKLTPMRGEPLAVTAVDEQRGLLGVQTSYNTEDGTSCWKVATNQGGDAEPESCDWTIQSFSPSGKDLVGFPSGIDGLGSSTVALLDTTTFEPAVTFEGTGLTYVQDVAWEDDDHVLAAVFEDDRWYLVRLGLDGSIERLDEADAGGNPDVSPFHFQAHAG